MNSYLTIDDLRRKAQKRLPRIAFNYLEGGADDERNVHRNRSSFADILFEPKYLIDVATRTQKTELFGREYNAPIGVSPVGLANLLWPGTDSNLATLAKSVNMPYVLSAAGTTSIEDIAKIAPEHAWFQLYVSHDPEITFDLIKRAANAGLEVLVVTIDIPVASKRLRELRSGFTLPFRITPSLVMDVIRHPAWLAATVKSGAPEFANISPYVPEGANRNVRAATMARQHSASVDEAFLARIREAWNGRLVVKGVLSPETAIAARNAGADGLIVSNHGGRVLSSAPATIEALPAIRKAVGPVMTIMLDGGIREGSDIVKALCLGADFTFSGRSFVYGSGAGGADGAARAYDILVDEIDRTLAQIGCPDLRNLSDANLWRGVGQAR